jgi:hypothetical protein
MCICNKATDGHSFVVCLGDCSRQCMLMRDPVVHVVSICCFWCCVCVRSCNCDLEFVVVVRPVEFVGVQFVRICECGRNVMNLGASMFACVCASLFDHVCLCERE